MKNYYKSWSLKRFFQLLIGLYFIWNFVEDRMIFSLLFGGLMTIQALLNIGCFSTKGCTVPVTNSSDNKAIDITFKEITKK